MSAATRVVAWLGAVGQAVGRPFAVAARWALRPLLRRRIERVSLTERTRQFTRQAAAQRQHPPTLRERVRSGLDALAAWTRPRAMVDLQGDHPRSDFGRRRHRPEAILIRLDVRDWFHARGIRNTALGEDIAHISAAARAIGEATARKAFRKAGGWDHPTLNAAAAVRDLGLVGAVELSQICQRIAATPGQDYLVDPAAWLSDNAFIRDALANGWLTRLTPAEA